LCKFGWPTLLILDFEPAKFRSATGVVRRSWNDRMPADLCSKSRPASIKEKETMHCDDTLCLVKSELRTKRRMQCVVTTPGDWWRVKLRQRTVSLNALSLAWTAVSSSERCPLTEPGKTADHEWIRSAAVDGWSPFIHQGV
jgi:hypothetical protein